METVIFIVVMLVGHMLMMYFMPGMHGRHAHTESDQTNNNSLEKENKQLKEEVYELKSKVRRNER
ncbi:hypothetical protein [Alkalibacterium sp. 20]|uniref:hypothetical protein n=1 Tax=Alkalibacterium sp. 20 TaxID=1798803 RepID=UPI0009000C3B|nr:hypothetical protein [Alkalibacterium sp. 20]OJF90182.1 hypothetical protein AX762_04730 [Alkalibacterium sp. 20]